jgi:hypothetical protein
MSVLVFWVVMLCGLNEIWSSHDGEDVYVGLLGYNTVLIYEIWSSHNSENVDVGLLDCNTVRICR